MKKSLSAFTIALLLLFSSCTTPPHNDGQVPAGIITISTSTRTVFACSSTAPYCATGFRMTEGNTVTNLLNPNEREITIQVIASDAGGLDRIGVGIRLESEQGYTVVEQPAGTVVEEQEPNEYERLHGYTSKQYRLEGDINHAVTGMIFPLKLRVQAGTVISVQALRFDYYGFGGYFGMCNITAE